MAKRKRRPAACLSVSPNSTREAVIIHFKRYTQRELIPRKLKEKRFYEAPSQAKYKKKKLFERLIKDVNRRRRREGVFSNTKRKGNRKIAVL